MRLMKIGSVLAGTFVLAAATAFVAKADTKEKIEEISFFLESRISAGETDSEGSIEIELDTDGCYLDDDAITVTNEPEDGWDEEDEPKIKVAIRAEDGYMFKTGLGKDDIYLDRDSGIVTSVSRSSSKVTIYITLPEVSESDRSYEDDEDYNLDVDEESLAWDAAGGGLVCWDGNDYAKRYELQLFCNGEELTSSVITTANTTYDFSPFLSKEGEYRFRVQAVRNENDKGGWQESEPRYIAEKELASISAGSRTNQPSAGTWIQDGSGWWWCRQDRTWPKNQWERIGNFWYWFNEGGYRLENRWVLVDGKHYYCGESGKMLSNTRTPDGFFVGADGAWDGAPAGQ
ncbi:MAG: hypothetical protein HFE84_10965 [Lachnospiraceae bacterium]|jgi:hypothetical protein|nr:hypothetical protein [Lachnospiraceae bacterium]